MQIDYDPLDPTDAELAAGDFIGRKLRRYWRQQHGRAGDVLGALGKIVQLVADAVDRRLDARVQQLDDHHQQHRADQQRDLDPAAADPESRRQQHGLQTERGYE